MPSNYKVIGMLRDAGLGKDINAHGEDPSEDAYKKLLEARARGVDPNLVGEPKFGAVPYLTPGERIVYEIQIINKLVCDKKGVPITTPQNRNWIFVMTSEGVIYSANKMTVIHHSSFLAGGPVAAAGCWILDNGVVKMINTESGHYQPTSDFNDQFVLELRKRGVNLNQTQLKFGASSAAFSRRNQANMKAKNKGKLEVVIDYL